MKLISWNVNGIRAAQKNGFLKWFEKEAADVVCVQEIKANEDQLDLFLKNPNGYHAYWFSAKKPGYSGVATFCKKEPLDVTYGMGAGEFDDEGRVVSVHFKNLVLINAYFPNSQRDHARLDYKLKFCKKMLQFCKSHVDVGKNIVLCGDYNIAHKEIDLKNPKQNENNAGFLPEERAWMDQFLKSGFKDAFREKNGDVKDEYTWWSYRPGVREKNIGWRLDYHSVNEDFLDQVKSVYHQQKVKGSDHCPVVLALKK